MLIAIDHGNCAIKTPNTSFVSGLAEYTVKPPLASDVIEFNGKYWTLTGQRINYMRDKTRDERFFILSLFAIAKELQLAGGIPPFVELDLAVGLPPEHISVLREKFSKYFRRSSIKFVYNDIPCCVTIRNVLVYPQAYAAVVPQSRMLINTPRMFIVDIGGYTTDVLLLRNGKPDLQFCRSLETGVITMTNEIIGKVSALHDISIEDDHIVSIISGQSTILPADVTETICTAVKQHASNILDKLRELHVDLRSTPAIFIGGGATLFRSYLEASPLVVKADFVLDPKANALGYQMLGNAQLGRQPAKTTGGDMIAVG